MMSTAAYTTTMTDLRPDGSHPASLWSNYPSSNHLPPRMSSALDSTYPAARPRSGNGPIDSQATYPYTRFSHEESPIYGRSQAPTLGSQSGYSSGLKRTFSQSEAGAPYQEMVQDLRDDGSRLSVSHDHKLLSFRRKEDNHTFVDQHGRVVQLDILGQLHGMFFLSEMPSNASDGSILQPELTCYRRNLFQISGSLVMPRGPISYVNEDNEPQLLSNMEVSVSAIESVDGNAVRLIVIPWKTPPPNSPDVNQSPDQEPSPVPLIPLPEEESDGEVAVYPIGWRRLQFRIATANNGRRKELQQHFVLHLKVHGTLPDNSRMLILEATTAPIVVRGRSPRNFQARKEIPLLGSSAGSRGQALVETGHGVIAGPLSAKSLDSKSIGLDMQVPRAPFTFSPPKAPGGPLSSLRSNTYPTWGTPSLPSTSPSTYTPSTLSTDPYPKPLTGPPNYTNEPQEMPLQTSMAPSIPLSLVSSEQTQPTMRAYSYTTAAQLPATTSLAAPDTSLGNVPRYVDNPRPLKSPRVTGPQTGSSLSNHHDSSEYRYGSYGRPSAPSTDVAPSSYNPEATPGNAGQPRDYYPSSSTWTSSAAEPAPSVAYASTKPPTYAFPQDQYKNSTVVPPIKAEPGPQAPPSVYGGSSRGSFDTMNNYSWSGN